MTQNEKADRFRALHAAQPFVMPNPWDVGSALMLQGLGFEALATTSSGFAATLGLADGGATLDQVVAHVEAIARATAVPLSVDLEDGHGPSPGDAATAIGRVAAAGAVGASIEDWDPREERLHDVDRACERLVAAREAADAVGFPFVLTGRAENFIRGNPDLADTVRRLRAYEAAGADVLYAPGLREADQIRAVCEGVEKPVNVLAFGTLSRDEIFAAGAQRITVGGRLAFLAFESAADIARRFAEQGAF